MLSFEQMANNIYTELEKQKTDDINLKITLPVVNNQTNKKTVWANLYKILEEMNRSKENDHFLKFLKDELDLSLSWKKNKDEGIIIDGIVKNKAIQTMLSKYIENYVVCKQCGSINSILKRNKVDRLWTFQCNSCNATENF
jgi:translation initiation factor 2 subunit 2